MTKPIENAYKKLIKIVKETKVLESCSHLLKWDERTYMPKQGSKHRSAQIALLAGMVHLKKTSPEMDDLLSELEESVIVKEPFSIQAVNIREIRQHYDKLTKLPPSLVEEIARVTTISQGIWRQARANSDFKMFEPYLRQIVELKQEKAKALSHEGDLLYDALLDKSDPGETTANLKKIFGLLRDELIVLIKNIETSGKSPDISFLKSNYPIDKQDTFGRTASKAIGFNFNSGRLDVTTHPFCKDIGIGDIRLTTNYTLNDFRSSFFSTLHESGHGIYQQGLDPSHYGTPMGDFISFGIYESQSRLWENFVGRSKGFWNYFFPKAKQIFPEALGRISLDEFYFSVNDVKKSFIRMKADEVTYNLHVLLRFELEQALICGELSVSDIPNAWNHLFKQYFDLTPPNDAKGCLQDLHWSAGGFGYFPSYTLGNLYAAQLFEQAKEELGDLDSQFSLGNFKPLKSWLTEKIYRQGKRYRSGELIKAITGKPLSHRPLMDHLNTKFGQLYEI